VNINDHLQEHLLKHFEVVFSRIKSLDDKLGESPTGSQTASVTVQGRMNELERKLLQLESARTDHEITSGATGEVTSAAVLPSKYVTDSSSIPTLTAEKMVVVEGVITVLNREMEKMTVDMEAQERQRRTERELLDNMDRKMRSMERLLAMKDATINELNIRLTSMEQTSFDGILLWRVTEVQKKRQDALSGRVTSVYSPAFFTSRTGAYYMIHVSLDVSYSLYLVIPFIY